MEERIMEPTPEGGAEDQGFEMTYGLFREGEAQSSKQNKSIEQALTWGFSFGVIGGMLLVGYHMHNMLHLGVGMAFLAMVAYIVQISFMLCVNLWFMAGQRYVIEFLALYEPTSCIMEYLHDTIFGISEDRLAAAYTVGGHRGRKTKDGKTYVQLIIPRRQIPYPFSIGGLVRFCFFALDDPFDSDKVVMQMMRSLIILSILGLVVQTSVQEWLFHADALFFEATNLQQQGDWHQAATTFQTVIKQDPTHNPHIAAVHFSHLFLRHPWAAGMYIVAANFHACGQLDEATRAYKQVVEHVDSCPLAEHALLAVSGDGALNAEHGRAPEGYVREAFDGYAATYDASMAALSFRAPEMLSLAIDDVIAALEGEGADHGRGMLGKIEKGIDLGCGSGGMGARVRERVRWLSGVDLSSRMLAAAEKSGQYDALTEGDMVTALVAAESQSLGLIVAADSLPYLGDLQPVVTAAAAALAKDGLLAFTVEAWAGQGDAGVEEAWEGPGWRLAASGRFLHRKKYVRGVVAAAGLRVVAVGDGPIRWQAGRPVEGYAFVARK